MSNVAVARSSCKCTGSYKTAVKGVLKPFGVKISGGALHPSAKHSDLEGRVMGEGY